ncbi:MAG: L,D-transpeptidase [Hyphomicrobiaceae bacterium]
MSVELRDTAKRRECGFVATLLTATCLLTALPVGAQAQSWFWPWGVEQRRSGSYERDRRRDWERAQKQRRQDKQAQPKFGKAARDVAKAPEGPILAVISLSSQRINVYGRRGHLAQSAVSTGMPGHRTPTGVFSVIQKNRYHESNIYSGAPMPWMQRLTWSGIALHGGVVPRYPASHGCVRLPHEFAARMWDMMRIGARVVVSPHDVEAVSFTHAALPVPAMTDKPAETVADRQMGPPTFEMAAASSATLTGGRLETSALAANVEGPQRRARVARTAAVANARAAEAALKPAQATAKKTAVAANAARTEFKRAERGLTAAEARLAALAKRKTVKPEAEGAARKAIDVAKARLADATEKEVRASEAATAAAQTAREAQLKRDTAAAQLQATASALEPVSVFVSAKEGRIYLRQGFTPLMDAPATIRDTGERLGTHLFKAISTSEDGSKVEWLSVTVPDAGAEGRMEAMRDRQLKKAQQALDRIEIPANIRAEIANRLWAGASLIVSDHGLNHEIGRGTDFVVLTK